MAYATYSELIEESFKIQSRRFEPDNNGVVLAFQYFEEVVPEVRGCGAGCSGNHQDRLLFAVGKAVRNVNCFSRFGFGEIVGASWGSLGG